MMMPHVLQTDSLPTLRAWAIQHYRNEIQDTILHHAPDSYSWEDCDEVEKIVLSHAKQTISTLTVEHLRCLSYMNCLIAEAAGETKRLMHSRPGKQTMKANLTMTPEESDVVELCLRSLTDEQIADCKVDILNDVVEDLEKEDYEDLLTTTMVAVLKRHARKLSLDRVLQRDRPPDT